MKWRPIGGSNPCYRRERAVSWTTRRMGRINTSRKTDRVCLSGNDSEDPFWISKLERERRFELPTLALARRCSTTELFPLIDVDTFGGDVMTWRS